MLSSALVLKAGLHIYVESWAQRLCLGLGSAPLLEVGLSAGARLGSAFDLLILFLCIIGFSIDSAMDFLISHCFIMRPLLVQQLTSLLSFGLSLGVLLIQHGILYFLWFINKVGLIPGAKLGSAFDLFIYFGLS